MLTGAIALTLLVVSLTTLLLWFDSRTATDASGLAALIESRLPRIQCGQCGYPGCAPYARAIAAGEAGINLCPPGGESTVIALGELIGETPVPVDYSGGTARLDRVALIDETTCIGCNLCLRVCPVDAIVGIQQMLHTVIADHCTGCELCLPPCPVDCIDMVTRDE